MILTQVLCVSLTVIIIIIQNCFVVEMCVNNLFKSSNPIIYTNSKENLKILVQHEFKILQSIQKYSVNIESTMKLINTYLNDYHTSTSNELELSDYSTINMYEQMQFLGDADKMAEEMIKHPLKSFKLIKRIAIDLSNIETQILTLAENIVESSLQVMRHNIQEPNEKDLKDAIASVIKYSDSQNNRFDDIVRFKSSLNAENYYQIGEYALENGEYTSAVGFLKQAIKIKKIEMQRKSKDKENYSIELPLWVVKLSEAKIKMNRHLKESATDDESHNEDL